MHTSSLLNKKGGSWLVGNLKTPLMLGSKLELLVNFRNQNSCIPFIFFISKSILLMKSYTSTEETWGILPMQYI